MEEFEPMRPVINRRVNLKRRNVILSIGDFPVFVVPLRIASSVFLFFIRLVLSGMASTALLHRLLLEAITMPGDYAWLKSGSHVTIL